MVYRVMSFQYTCNILRLQYSIFIAQRLILTEEFLEFFFDLLGLTIDKLRNLYELLFLLLGVGSYFGSCDRFNPSDP